MNELALVARHEPQPPQTASPPIRQFTPLTAPGLHAIDPASLIWPGQDDKKGLLHTGIEHLALWVHGLGASDLHLQAGEPAKINYHGRMFPVTARAIEQRDIDHIATYVYGAGYQAWLYAKNSFRVGKTVRVLSDRSNRYVVGEHRQLSGAVEQRYAFRWQGSGNKIFGATSCQLTARIINRVPPRHAELRTEPEIIDYSRPRNGLVLVTGQPSMGKTSLVAAMMLQDLQDPAFNGKIIELADPQEYVFDGYSTGSSMYTVSEIGHEGNYRDSVQALQDTFSRAPSVIVAPEMRSKEDIHLALLSAQTGTRTIATIHTNNVVETIPRILMPFQPDEREARAHVLMDNLRLIVCCRLVPTIDGRRVQLREFMPFTPVIRQQLKALSFHEWPMLCRELIQSSGQTFNQAAQIACDEGLISEDTLSHIIEERQ